MDRSGWISPLSYPSLCIMHPLDAGPIGGPVPVVVLRCSFGRLPRYLEASERLQEHHPKRRPPALCSTQQRTAPIAPLKRPPVHDLAPAEAPQRAEEEAPERDPSLIPSAGGCQYLSWRREQREPRQWPSSSPGPLLASAAASRPKEALLSLSAALFGLYLWQAVLSLLGHNDDEAAILCCGRVLRVELGPIDRAAQCLQRRRRSSEDDTRGFTPVQCPSVCG